MSERMVPGSPPSTSLRPGLLIPLLGPATSSQCQRGQLPEGSTSPTALDGVVGYVAKVLVVGHEVPLGVVLVALADDSHLSNRLRIALGHYGAGISAGKEQMVVIDAVGTHGCGARGGIDLGEVTVLVELQDVLLNALVGRVGAEIDIVAEGDCHAVIDAGPPVHSVLNSPVLRL